MKIFYALFSIFLINLPCSTAQNLSDQDRIRLLHEAALTRGRSYEWLEFLCKKIGNRLSGSPQLAAATNYTAGVMRSLSFDTVWLQPCKVPHWERGPREICRVTGSAMGSFDLNVLALGNTWGTGPKGLFGEVIAVRSLEELDRMDAEKIKGKVVYFNRPFTETTVSTFEAYGLTVDQRSRGPQLAARKGAIAALVRSVTGADDDQPHTGGSRFDEDGPFIAAYAVGCQSADRLDQALQAGKVTVYCQSESRMLPDADGWNVIGEIRGSESPEEVIIVSGHLDSWDTGEGAHDDGAGCVQSIEALHLLQLTGYKPRRTIRAILYTNEENGVAGGNAYRKYADAASEKHIMAIESDAGGHSPQGFFYESTEVYGKQYASTISKWEASLREYGYRFVAGGSGVDITPLKPLNTFLLGLMPDSQRYFDYHHSANDTFDKVNRRELALGSAAMASILYLADKYGVK